MLPSYFFHQRHDGLGIDAVGIDLPDLEAARDRAIELAREILSDEVLSGEVALDRSIEVTDTAGQVVLVVPFAEAVTLRLRRASRKSRRARLARTLAPTPERHRGRRQRAPSRQHKSR